MLFRILSFLIVIHCISCSSETNVSVKYNNYSSLSRYTDPKDLASMLNSLPKDINRICDIAKQQTVHHNLLPHFEVPQSEWKSINRVWPYKEPFPGMRNILSALNESGPKNLNGQREVKHRLIGGCILESTFLTGLLRHQKIPARIRAGYFQNTMTDSSHVIQFWEKVSKEKGIEKELLATNPSIWKKVMNRITRQQQVEVDKHIEHWICEYWDKDKQKWKLLDANNTFLKASSNIDVSYHLPNKYFEFAYEAWYKMRNSKDFDPDQYTEWPQDGHSHIRSQLLIDFYNLLNHDLAGYDNRTGNSYEFIKVKKYDDVSPEEMKELDALAKLLSNDPTKQILIEFYKNSKTLKIKSMEEDKFSFIYLYNLNTTTNNN